MGSFPALDISSQGRTHEEAMRNLIEAAQLFIEDCFERGVLDEVLKGAGFTLAKGVDTRHAGDQGEQLTVPIELIAARDGCEARAG